MVLHFCTGSPHRVSTDHVYNPTGLLSPELHSIIMLKCSVSEFSSRTLTALHDQVKLAAMRTCRAPRTLGWDALDANTVKQLDAL